MKYLYIMLISSLCMIYGCANESESTTKNGGTEANAQTSTQAAQQSQPNSMIGDVNFQNGNQPAQVTQPQRPVEPPQNSDGVWHYTCPNGCEGGAGSAIDCPKCGTRLKHNTGYHNNAGAPGQSPVIQNPTMNGNPVTPQPSANPKNDAGVWHYACSNTACDGGGGGPGSCPKCGSALKHNTAYHN